MDGRWRGTGTGKLCTVRVWLWASISIPQLARAGFQVHGARPFWSRRHATLARILTLSLSLSLTPTQLLHPNFHQTSLPRHPPFRPSDKTILSSFPRSVFLLPSRDHPAIGRHCSSSKSSVPLQSWNSISISELQCLSLSAPPPRSLTSAHCHPFPASQLPPFHISKPTPSDRLQRDLYRTLELRNPRAKLHTSIHSAPSRETRPIPESWLSPERCSRSRFVHFLTVADTANPARAAILSRLLDAVANLLFSVCSASSLAMVLLEK